MQKSLHYYTVNPYSNHGQRYLRGSCKVEGFEEEKTADATGRQTMRQDLHPQGIREEMLSRHRILHIREESGTG